MKAILTVTNSIYLDQRVLKMAGVLQDEGHEVLIVGRLWPSKGRPEVPGFASRRFRMLFHRGAGFYAFFNLRLFFFLLFRRFDLLVANDLDTLLPAVLVSGWKRKPLVFDAHEYFKGIPEVRENKAAFEVWRRIETFCLKRVKEMLTVNESLAALFAEEYGQKPVVVRNVSAVWQPKVPRTRVEIDVPQKALLVVMQGTGMHADRGGAELMEALRECAGVYVLLIGSGTALPVLERKMQTWGLQNRVRLLPRMPWAEMMSYTALADLGVSLDRGTHLNYRLSLPNKIFDYLQAGIPFLATDLPEIRKIALQCQCGRLIPDPPQPEDIARELKELQHAHESLGVLKEKAREAARVLNWNEEAKIVRAFYRRWSD